MKLIRQSDDLRDPLYRLAVEDDYGTSGLLTVSEEETTSTAPTAQTTRVRTALDLTPTEAAWLYDALGRMLAARAKGRAKGAA